MGVRGGASLPFAVLVLGALVLGRLRRGGAVVHRQRGGQGSVRAGASRCMPGSTSPVRTTPNTIFNDPLTGYYSVSLTDGATYYFVVTSQIPGYNQGIADVPVNVPDIVNDPPGIIANFDLTVDSGLCIAPGYTPGEPTPLWSESFDGGELPEGWESIDNSGSGPWQIVSDFAPCNEVTGNSDGRLGGLRADQQRLRRVRLPRYGAADVVDRPVRVGRRDSELQTGLLQPGRHGGRGREHGRR